MISTHGGAEDETSAAVGLEARHMYQRLEDNVHLDIYRN
jgi:hypothetical protein